MTEAENVGSPLVAKDLVLDQALSKATEDEFERKAIAARVGDLVATADPPLSIALFGPWGSGKSSMAELIRDRLAARADEQRALLAGTPLRKNHELRPQVPEAAPSAADSEPRPGAHVVNTEREPPEPATPGEEPGAAAEVAVAEVSRAAALPAAVLLNNRPERIKLVRYDAWKYGGRALRRNFISNAATALGFPASDPRWRDFHRGMYEKRRRVEFQSGRLWRLSLRIGLQSFAIFLAVALAFVGAVALNAWLRHKNLGSELDQKVGNFFLGGAILAFVTGTLRVILDSARADIEQEAPSEDEEFSNAFRKLIAAAREQPVPRKGFRRPVLAVRRWWAWLRVELSERWERRWTGISKEDQDERRPAERGGYDRLVFFIDELDRCTERDVVETLVAIRTFLDEEGCIFVVAADRAVLEEALAREAPQATPINEDEPYYSSAGAFLDKIFQHQLTLPPFRGRRLTRFALDLVKERDAGLWCELEEAKPKSLLEDVIYVLVPSHVRSPRRIKVLLNAFATSARMAQARGVEWPERATEIAKLVVLRTEFPPLAEELFMEPRLPEYLLAEELPTGARAQSLVARFAFDEKESSEEATSTKKGQRPVERYISDDKSNQERQEVRARKSTMSRTHRLQLLRYLQRTAHVPELRRDLLYLEAAGASFFLADPELGEDIERDAPDDPVEALKHLEGVDTEERNKVVQLLADMVQDMIGPERQRVMTVLMDVVEGLSEELSPAAATDARKALTTYQQHEPLQEQLLIGALALAIEGEDHDARELRGTLFEDGRLLASERLAEVAKRWGDLDESERVLVSTQVAAQLSEGSSDAFTATFNTIPEEEDALSFLRHDLISPALIERLDGTSTAAASTATALADAMLGASLDQQDEYPDLLLGTIDFLLANAAEVAERACDQRWAAISAVLDTPTHRGYALSCWEIGPQERWAQWSQRADGNEVPSGQPTVAARIMVKIFQGYSGLDAGSQAQITTWMTELAAFMGAAWPEEPTDAELLSVLSTALEAEERWWISSDESQIALHEAAHFLARRFSELSARIWILLSDDLTRRRTSYSAQLADSEEGRTAIRELAPPMPEEQIYEVFASLASGPEPDLVWTRALLAREARKALGDDWEAGRYPIDAGELEAVAATATAEGDNAVLAWLATKPSPARVVAAARSMKYRRIDGLDTALTGWAQDHRPGQRTELVKRLIERPGSAAWITPIAQVGISEAALIDQLHAKVKEASNRHERARWAALARAIGPQTPSGQKALAQLAASLLRGSKKDIPTGQRLIEVLGDTHGHKTELRKAVNYAGKRAEARLTPQQAADLERLGIDPPKEWLPRKRGKELAKFARETARRLNPLG